MMPSLDEDFGVYEQPAQAERRRRQVAAQLSAPVALPGVSSRCVRLGQNADLRRALVSCLSLLWNMYCMGIRCPDAQSTPSTCISDLEAPTLPVTL
jgi:hypothetical protein